MTVVNPKSISGINSITTGSGSDNLLTIHTSDASNTERFRIDSTGTTKIVTGIVTTLTATTGIVTTLTTNTLTANSTTKVGSGITVSPDGDIFATGVTTSTTFVGALTGNVTGNISGGTVAGSTGTFSGNLSIADALVHTGDDSQIRFPAADTVSVETGGSERLRIDSSGRLLFGINSSISGIPIQIASGYIQQYVAGNNADPGYFDILKTRNAAASGNTILQDGDQIGQIRFRGNTGSGYVNGALIRAVVNGTPGSGNDLPTDLQFHTMPDGSGSTNERLRIDSSGRVIIGSTSTIGNQYSDNFTVSDSSGHAGIQIEGNNSNSNYASIYMGDAGSRYRSFLETQLGSNGNFTIATTGSGPIRFNNSGGERMRVQGSGGISFNGDTAAANALDDYEEGGWTMTAYQGADSVTQSAANQRYTKIGNMVTVVGEVNGLTNTTSSVFTLAGLPYNVATGREGAGSAFSNDVTFPSGYNGITVYTYAGSDRLRFYVSTSGGGWHGVQGNQIGAGDIIFTASYLTS